MATALPNEILLMIAEHMVIGEVSRHERKLTLQKLGRVNSVFAECARRHMFKKATVTAAIGSSWGLKEDVDMLSQEHIARCIKELRLGLFNDRYGYGSLELDRERCCINTGRWAAKASVQITRLMQGCRGLEKLTLESCSKVHINYSMPFVAIAVDVLSSFRFSRLKSLMVLTNRIGDLEAFWDHQDEEGEHSTLEANLEVIEKFKLKGEGPQFGYPDVRNSDVDLRRFEAWLASFQSLQSLDLANLFHHPGRSGAILIQAFTTFTELRDLKLSELDVNNKLSPVLTAAKHLRSVNLSDCRLFSAGDIWANVFHALLALPALENVKLLSLGYRDNPFQSTGEEPCPNTLCTMLEEDETAFKELVERFSNRGRQLQENASAWTICI